MIETAVVPVAPVQSIPVPETVLRPPPAPSLGLSFLAEHLDLPPERLEALLSDAVGGNRVAVRRVINLADYAHSVRITSEIIHALRRMGMQKDKTLEELAGIFVEQHEPRYLP